MSFQERVRDILDYNPDTGVFTWKIGGRRRAIGKIAGCLDDRGYVIIGIDTKGYGAHRLAWLFVYGKWPERNLDHKNGICNDNRIDNLREATQSQNCANKRVVRDGLKGCYFNKARSKWRAQIRKSGVSNYLGDFSSEQEAHDAYMVAAGRIHMEFARAA